MKLDELKNCIPILKEDYDSDTGDYVIESNIMIINLCKSEYIRSDELCPEVLKSYYVDYFLAQVNNGGFAQYVYNSGWSETVSNYVREGLKDMKASSYLSVWDKMTESVSELTDEELKSFLNSDLFGENSLRDRLNQYNSDFYSLEKDLREINNSWLRSHPKLKLIPNDSIREEIEEVVNDLPDLEERIAAARAAEPRYMKLMRKLCEKASMTFSHPTAASPKDINGEKVFTQHFRTDEEHYYMVDYSSHAIMYDDDDNEVARLEDCSEIE